MGLLLRKWSGQRLVRVLTEQLLCGLICWAADEVTIRDPLVDSSFRIGVMERFNSTGAARLYVIKFLAGHSFPIIEILLQIHP